MTLTTTTGTASYPFEHEPTEFTMRMMDDDDVPCRCCIGSTYESEYDNYRPGMASDEDYFVPEPISDIDIDMFDDVINVDDVTVGGEAMTDTYGYLPLKHPLSHSLTHPHPPGQPQHKVNSDV